VVASFRTDDKDANRSGASNLHQFYITTKVGPVNIKAGDFYSTIGLGAWSKGGKSTDALSLSTKVGPVTLGIYTTNGGEVDTIEGKNVTTGTGTTAKTVVEYTPVTKTIASTTHISALILTGPTLVVI
jgi:hypothetical protein